MRWKTRLFCESCYARWSFPLLWLAFFFSKCRFPINFLSEHKCQSTCSGKGACLYDGAKPQCYCDSGFSGSACELQDKNECLEHPCHMMAQCQNTLGSYECRCLPGYEGNGHECTDIDECSDKLTSRCPEHSKCINLPGTYYCNCTQGFTPKVGFCHNYHKHKNLFLI